MSSLTETETNQYILEGHNPNTGHYVSEMATAANCFSRDRHSVCVRLSVCHLANRRRRILKETQLKVV